MRKSLFRIAQLALLVLAVTAPTAAFARSYYVVRPSPEMWVIFDPSAREPASEPDVVRVWMVTVQKNIFATQPAQPGYVRSLNEYDCTGQRARWLNFSAFFRDGSSALERTNSSRDWEAVKDKPAREAELRLVCGLIPPENVLAAESVARLVVTLMSSWDSDLDIAPPPPAATPAAAAPSRAKAPAPKPPTKR